MCHCKAKGRSATEELTFCRKKQLEDSMNKLKVKLEELKERKHFGLVLKNFLCSIEAESYRELVKAY